MQKTLIALAALAAFGAAQAQTKWDMPTPYSDGEFHTLRRQPPSQIGDEDIVGRRVGDEDLVHRAAPQGLDVVSTGQRDTRHRRAHTLPSSIGAGPLAAPREMPAHAYPPDVQPVLQR